MVTCYIMPGSIEAKKAIAKARKVIPLRPIRNKTIACLTFPFKLDMNSEIHVTKELDPKKAKIKNSSLLSKGDSLCGDMIYGYSIKPVPSPRIKKGSSTHKANFLKINKFVFAELEKSFKSIENISHLKIV